MRTLGIDLGSRRVGVAMSDEGGRFATPLEVLEVGSEGEALTLIAALVRREGVGRAVVGVPLNMDGSVGPAARGAIDWGKKLATHAGVGVVFVDERLSSFAAEQAIVERKRGGEKITRAGKKKRLDAIAAAGFLQDFLDGKLAALEVGD
jgi:putative Holliday junction resolvase